MDSPEKKEKNPAGPPTFRPPADGPPPELTWEDLVRRAKTFRGPSETEDLQILREKLGEEEK